MMERSRAAGEGVISEGMRLTHRVLRQRVFSIAFLISTPALADKAAVLDNAIGWMGEKSWQVMGLA
jgi:hypothetical protein